MNLSNYISKYAAEKDKYNVVGSLAAGYGAGFLGQQVQAPISRYGLKKIMTLKLDKNQNPVDTLDNKKRAKLRKEIKVRPSVKIIAEDLLGMEGPYSYSGHTKVHGTSPIGSKLEVKVPSHVYVPKGSHPAALAHELGHSSGIGRNKYYNKISNTADTNGVKGIAQALIFLSPEGSVAEKAGIAGIVGSQAVTLGEEARASIKGLKAMSKAGLKVKGSKRLLASAFSTYLAGAGTEGAIVYGMYKGKRLLTRKNLKKKLKEKRDESK
jgi:hypothetical protein